MSNTINLNTTQELKKLNLFYEFEKGELQLFRITKTQKLIKKKLSLNNNGIGFYSHRGVNYSYLTLIKHIKEQEPLKKGINRKFSTKLRKRVKKSLWTRLCKMLGV